MEIVLWKMRRGKNSTLSWIHDLGGKGNKPEMIEFTYNLDTHSSLLKGNMWSYKIGEGNWLIRGLQDQRNAQSFG